MTIVIWAIGWLIGIALGSWLDLPLAWWLVMGATALAAAVFLRRLSYSSALLLLLAGAALGAARYQQSQPIVDQTHIAYFNNQTVTVSGLVVKPPAVYETYQNVVLKTTGLAPVEGEPRAIQGRLLVRTPREESVAYGDWLQVEGDLEEASRTPLFDFRAYLAHQGILATMDDPAILTLSRGSGSPLMHLLLAMRERAQESINALFPQPQAALLSGILLGNDEMLPPELDNDFRAAGLTHIIAISGFNMAIIAGALLNGGRHLIGRRAAAWLALAGIGFYAAFVGAGASVVRAAIMAALFVIAAALLGRPTFTPAALLAAAFAMTLANPNALWDVGFQLSLAATLGLMLYVGTWTTTLRPRLHSLLGKEEGNAATRAAADVLLSTMAALLLTFPLLLYHFHTFSLVSPLANLLVLPAQPGLMAAGGLATIAGMINPLLGQPPAWIAWLFLTYTIVLARFFGGLPFATTSLTLTVAGVVVYYALIAFGTWSLRGLSAGTDAAQGRTLPLSRRARQVLLLAALIGGTLVIAWAGQRPDGRLHIAFLDVGQGDAILIETPDRRQVLVDGGRYPALLLTRLGDQIPFWDKQLDLVVITHADDDHAAGLADLFDQYGVGQLLVNGVQGRSGTPYTVVLNAAADHGVPVQQALAGERIDLGAGVELEVLHAGDDSDNFDDNNDSVVLRLSYDQFSLLLTGDAELPVEQQLLAGGRNLQATVLKAGHHGSQEATSARFLQAVHPQLVIISAGAPNRYGHPHEETLQRIAATGALIWRTDQSGTIELSSDGKTIWGNTEKHMLEQP